MEKTKNGFLKGAIILFLCGVVSKLLGAIYKIPLLKTLGSQGLGEYQMVLGVYALFLVIASSGIVVTLSKYISKESQYKNKKNQKQYFLTGLLLTLCISIFVSIILALLSPLISRYQGIEGLSKVYLITIPILIFSSLISVFRGYFLGKRKMSISGGVQVVEALTKLVFSLYLATIFSKQGTQMAVFGAVLGIGISEIISFAFLLILFFATKKNIDSISKKINKNKRYDFSKTIVGFSLHAKNRNKSFLSAIKDVFVMSFFVMLQACILPFVTAIDGLIVVPLLTKTGLSQKIAYSLFGLEDGVVASIIAMPLIISTSVGSAIIPNIKNTKQNGELVKNGLKIVWLVSIFCTFVFVFFAKEITSFLYSGGLSTDTINELNISSDLLKINGFNIVYMCLLSLSTSILQGLDKSKVPVINLLVASAFRFAILIVFLPNGSVNIYGLALADMTFYVVALALNLMKIKKLTNISLSFGQNFLLPVTSCTVVVLSMELLKILFTNLISARFLTLLLILIGGGIYLMLLSVTRVLRPRELLSLRKKSQS